MFMLSAYYEVLFYYTLLLGACYLIGGVPTSYILTRWLCNTDIRNHGSGNSGATNASRLLGKKFFFLIVLIDAGKAYGAIALAQRFFPLFDGFILYPLLWCAAAVLVGNGFSPFLQFYGGKSVATGLGLLCAFLPTKFVLTYTSVFIAMMMLSWRVDVSALTAVLTGALLVSENGGVPSEISIALYVLAAWVWGRHWENILYLTGLYEIERC